MYLYIIRFMSISIYLSIYIYIYIYMLGITNLSPYDELIYMPYIAVATNTSSREGEEPLRITKAYTIVGLYPYSVFTNPRFLSTNSLSTVYTFSWEYNYYLTYRGLSFIYYYKRSLTRTQQYIYIYIYIYILFSPVKPKSGIIPSGQSSSSSSCRATCMDSSDPLSPLLPIVHRHR